MTYIIRIMKKEEREWEENYLKKLGPKFPKVIKMINPQIQEVQQNPNTRNIKLVTLRNIINGFASNQ